MESSWNSPVPLANTIWLSRKKKVSSASLAPFVVTVTSAVVSVSPAWNSQLLEVAPNSDADKFVMAKVCDVV